MARKLAFVLLCIAALAGDASAQFPNIKKIKEAAKWSDGTPVTADDVAYTWASHIKYSTPTGANNKDYIENIEAVDPQTVVVKAKLDDEGKAINPLVVAQYLSSNYVIQKAWTETLEEYVSERTA